MQMENPSMSMKWTVKAMKKPREIEREGGAYLESVTSRNEFEWKGYVKKID